MEDYKTIRSISEIDDYLGSSNVVAFDFETSGTDYFKEF